MEHGTVIKAIEGYPGRQWLAGAELFDLFQLQGSENDQKEQKSLAYALEFTHPGRTLKDKEVEKELAGLVSYLEKTLGVSRRSS